MVHAVVEQVARESYGRLLALLAAPTGDILAAEDAIADALERALARWPHDGIPGNPEGWILTVARNRLRDPWKSHGFRMTEPSAEIESAASSFDEAGGIPDRRLELMRAYQRFWKPSTARTRSTGPAGAYLSIHSPGKPGIWRWC